jgi:ring-1,2-phenylacetyl-CoA epoxidase subunit PaaE
MSQYSELKVKEVIRETEDAITIVLEQPGEKLPYKSGQFLTLIIPIEGEKHRRSYSLSSSPVIDEHLAVTVKMVAGGKISTHLVKNLRQGDSIEVMHPMGNFTTDYNYQNKRNVVLIGAGSGITPLISIAKSILCQEPLSNVFLIYGNRNENTIIFKDQLNLLKKEHGDRLNTVHVLSQPLSKLTVPSGRLNQTALIKLLESFPNLNFITAEYYICGPHGLMEEAKKALEILQVPNTKIHKESFQPASDNNTPNTSAVAQPGPGNEQEVTILYQGSEYKFIVPKGKTILEAALDEDIDLPYSCQSGMCTACMGKCTSGKVKLDDPDGLSDKEIQQGFVLTCVGHPASADVVIEID